MELFVHVENSHIFLYAFLHLLLGFDLVELLPGEDGPVAILSLAYGKLEIVIVAVLEFGLQLFDFI